VQVTVWRASPWTVLDVGELQPKLQPASRCLLITPSAVDPPANRKSSRRGAGDAAGRFILLGSLWATYNGCNWMPGWVVVEQHGT
jgi:hypothetical protein